MSRRESDGKRYVFPRERMEKWEGWYELIFIALFVVVGVCCAVATNQEIRTALWHSILNLFGISVG